ncbi:unnamed protein product [Pleuronectes platessa]|uniref:Uncharacterized protein n=1 Tax=Pleuronectes platessa TaxID=8262 RepID=A0A9N7Z2N3_PLEPL|nr:unnamed protein product [Pleuronectes platessa]
MWHRLSGEIHLTPPPEDSTSSGALGPHAPLTPSTPTLCVAVEREGGFNLVRDAMKLQRTRIHVCTSATRQQHVSNTSATRHSMKNKLPVTELKLFVLHLQRLFEGVSSDFILSLCTFNMEPDRYVTAASSGTYLPFGFRPDFLARLKTSGGDITGVLIKPRRWFLKGYHRFHLDRDLLQGGAEREVSRRCRRLLAVGTRA